MADERTYYVLRADNCRFEGMTKEQILAAITQAVEFGEIRDVDTGFVTKIVEKNGNRQVTFWVGTQAQYNEIETKDTNCLYIITDDDTVEAMKDGLLNAVNSIAALKDSTAVIDISDQIELAAPNGTCLVNATISNKKYIYSKNLGIVFYNISVVGASAAASSYATLYHFGGFNPRVSSNPCAICVTAGYENLASASADYISDENSVSIKMRFGREIAADENIILHLNGWYFAREVNE